MGALMHGVDALQGFHVKGVQLGDGKNVRLGQNQLSVKGDGTTNLHRSGESGLAPSQIAQGIAKLGLQDDSIILR